MQTQVLPYLRYLCAFGLDVSLLTFEPKQPSKLSASDIDEWRAKLKAEGIRWLSLPYHKRPSVAATAYDIFAGARLAARLVRKEGIEVLHARSHMPMAMALLASRLTRCKLIFDIRGLMAEEYADAGIWTEVSAPFRAVKRVERAGIRRADQIVVLTERLREWLIDHKLKPAQQIEVIPCCVDFARFAEQGKENEEASAAAEDGRFEVVYSGSLMGLYLVEEMGRFFREIKAMRTGAFLRILSVSPPEHGIAALKRAGLDVGDFAIEAVLPADVPKHLHRARLGLSFRKSSFAQIAASPTKIPEYLAVGLPVVCNAGIGDMDKLVERERVGVILHDFDDATYQTTAARALALAKDADVRERCMRTARAHFDLQTVGGQKYVNVYRRLG